MPDKFDRRRLLIGSAGFALLLGMAGTEPAFAARKPNFIVVLCDDLGYGDIGPNGNRSIPTPNLDRMAREGTVLTDYYAPQNLCTPSRAGLLTGRYAVRAGLARGVIMANEDRGLPLDSVTIPQALKPAGYTSAHIGKWHLGHQGRYWPPTVHGFDLFFGIPYSHDMVPLTIYEAKVGTTQVSETPADFHFPGANRFNPATDDVTNLTSTLEQQFYGRAERFIEDNKERPFYLQLSLSTPHLPEIPSPAFKGRSVEGPYGDTIMEIDSIVGRLLNKLRDLSLDRDTLVIFTSDNGPWYWGSSVPLRDRKGGAAYDGGYRVPCIAWRPGTIPAGKRVNGVCSGIDFLPTFCAMAGATAGPALDGIDITGVLQRGEHIDREFVLFQGAEPVAIRTQKWKYIAINQYKVFGYDELYDMSIDPSESYNVRALHPEEAKAMRERFQQLQALFKPLADKQS